MEGLEVTYRLGMALWNRMPEPVLAIHTYNIDYVWNLGTFICRSYGL